MRDAYEATKESYPMYPQYDILDANGHLVGLSKSLHGAKVSARAHSKKEASVSFTVVDPHGKVQATYVNGEEVH